MSLGFTGENSDWDDKLYRDVIHIGLLYTLWYCLFYFQVEKTDGRGMLLDDMGNMGLWKDFESQENGHRWDH